MAEPSSPPPRFKREVRDFISFLRRPGLAPRLAGRRVGSGVAADWLSGLSVKRLLQWALLLWTLNLVFLGPIAVMAAGAGGAQHRLNLDAIPWLQALLWAPVVEELVFRYGLRRIAHIVWLVPAAVVAMLYGPGWSTGLLLLAVLLICWRTGARRSYTARQGQGQGQAGGRGWRLMLGYRRFFPWVFYLASLAFAAVHLFNFNMHQTPLWLMPLLVLPQWLTGLVLGWMRIRRGIGAAILLHALFNGGPLLIVWMILRWAPQIAT